MPRALRRSRHRCVDPWVAGRRDDESDAVEVDRIERARAEFGDLDTGEVLGHLGGNEPDESPGRGQPLGLAGPDTASTDDEDGHVVQVEDDRIGELRCRVTSGRIVHSTSVETQFPTKLICLIGF